MRPFLVFFGMVVFLVVGIYAYSVWDNNTCLERGPVMTTCTTCDEFMFINGSMFCYGRTPCVRTECLRRKP
jgi:hypothetical protein